MSLHKTLGLIAEYTDGSGDDIESETISLLEFALSEALIELPKEKRKLVEDQLVDEIKFRTQRRARRAA